MFGLDPSAEGRPDMDAVHSVLLLCRGGRGASPPTFDEARDEAKGNREDAETLNHFGSRHHLTFRAFAFSSRPAVLSPCFPRGTPISWQKHVNNGVRGMDDEEPERDAKTENQLLGLD